MIHGASEGDHAGGDEVVGGQLARFHDVEPADHVSHAPAYLLVIANVIARQLGVPLGQLGGAERNETIVKLFRSQEFAGWRRRQFKPLDRLDFAQLLENPITLRALRLPENVKTSEPGRESETGQEKNRYRPGEDVGLLPAFAPVRRLIVAKIISIHLNAPVLRTIRFQAGRAASKDVPHPQVRAAFGFSI